MAGIPLAILDSIICWWVFSSLVQTTRTLRLRRNLVKLHLYRQFTNTLICAVLGICVVAYVPGPLNASTFSGSIVFMMWQIRNHRFTSCLRDWDQIWVDEAYWHVLFSVILLVIMVLWRPTNNNQRYAFTPLLDASDDEDLEPLTAISDAFGKFSLLSSEFRLYESYSSDGIKMRQQRNSISGNSSTGSKDGILSKETEDDLKWVEENIPSSFVDR